MAVLEDAKEFSFAKKSKELPYAGGKLKLRIPFVHYRIEYQDFIQGVILSCVPLGITAAMVKEATEAQPKPTSITTMTTKLMGNIGHHRAVAHPTLGPVPAPPRQPRNMDQL